MKWKRLGNRISIAGVQYSDYQKIDKKLKLGKILALVGEPSNPFDCCAIRVEADGIHIGYIPKHSIEQSYIWEAHRKGRKVIAILTAINRTNPTWSWYSIEIKVSECPVSVRQGKIYFGEIRDSLLQR